MARTARINRKTAETQIELELNLDGAGQARVATGVGFLDHMLTLLAKHGALDLTVKATGDLEVDQHHTVEDVGIAFGATRRASRAMGSAPCRWTRRWRSWRSTFRDAPIWHTT